MGGFKARYFFESQGFVDQTKAKYLDDPPHQEIPRQKDTLKRVDPVAFLKQAAEIPDCDLGLFRKSSRISEIHEDTRDLLICLLWKSGLMANQAIGDLFGLTYSSLSRRVGVGRAKKQVDKRCRGKLEKLKSQIKM